MEDHYLIIQLWRKKKKINKRIVQNRKNDYFSILATPNRSNTIDNYQLSIVYAMPYVNEVTGEIKAKIYNFSNIYYIINNEVYKVGSFERQVAPKLSTGRQIGNIPVSIQAIGNNPVTGNIIDDVKVGVYEDNNIYFNQEISSIRR